jgi:hypothetical protein
MEFSCEPFFRRKRRRLRCFRVIGTLGFSSWSLVAAPGHRFPRAVWLLGARPSANTAPDGVCGGSVSQTPLGFRHKRDKNTGTECIKIRRNLVKHEVSETIGLLNRSKRRTERGLRDRRPAPKPSFSIETGQTHRVRRFSKVHFDPSKTRYFCNRKLLKPRKTRGFGLAKAAKPRTGQLKTMVFSSGSLVAAPGHRFPRAVWLLGARAVADAIRG